MYFRAMFKRKKTYKIHIKYKIMFVIFTYNMWSKNIAKNTPLSKTRPWRV